MSGRDDVEAYLAALDEPERAALQHLRDLILAVAPEAEEKISYGMPTFKLHGSLVGYASFKHHLSFFPMSSEVIDGYADELADFKTSKGTIQFHVDAPIPDDLVRRIVEQRVAQNLASR